jgi:large subunit ribosomal protein L1
MTDKKTTAKKTKKEEIVEAVEVAETPIVEATTVTETPEETKVAKAGKRSAKAIEETEEKQAKEERKVSDEDAAERPKQHSNPTRSRLARRAKGFRKVAEALEADKVYSLDEAVALAMKTSHVKFDASVELHVNLSVDPRQADQNIRDNLVLPHGTGRSVRIAVLTEDDTAAIAAGADIAGVDNLLAELEKGLMNFDILISTPALMARLGKYARALGPRGLMPNPKSGTVTNDVQKAIAEAKAGKVEYRVDSTGIVHLAVGKVSFTEVQLMGNLQAVLASIKSNKPSSVKSNYFKAAHLSTSMGPSIKVDLGTIN